MVTSRILFTAIPLKTRQTPRSWHISAACCAHGLAAVQRREAMELRRWKDDSNPYHLPHPLVRDKLPTR